jgi:hypothetical protein
MYLYCMLWPGGRSIVTLHSGLPDVYWFALSAITALVLQDPSRVMLPTTLMAWPYVVATTLLKETATAVSVLLQALVAKVVETALSVLVAEEEELKAEPQGPEPESAAVGKKILGKPPDMDPAMLPLLSAITALQVKISVTKVPHV